MKTALIFTLLAFTTSTAIACSPPPMLMFQQAQLNQAISSKAYNKALSEQMARDFNVQILSISVEVDVVISLSNGCAIRLSSHYKSHPDQGMCPIFVKVTSKTACNQ